MKVQYFFSFGFCIVSREYDLVKYPDMVEVSRKRAERLISERYESGGWKVSTNDTELERNPFEVKLLGKLKKGEYFRLAGGDLVYLVSKATKAYIAYNSVKDMLSGGFKVRTSSTRLVEYGFTY